MLLQCSIDCLKLAFMNYDDLIEFLARSATELVRDAEVMGAKDRGRMLDEAAELLSLGAGLLTKRTTIVHRRAA